MVVECMVVMVQAAIVLVVTALTAIVALDLIVAML